MILETTTKILISTAGKQYIYWSTAALLFCREFFSCEFLAKSWFFARKISSSFFSTFSPSSLVAFHSSVTWYPTMPCKAINLSPIESEWGLHHIMSWAFTMMVQSHRNLLPIHVMLNRTHSLFAEFSLI